MLQTRDLVLAGPVKGKGQRTTCGGARGRVQGDQDPHGEPGRGAWERAVRRVDTALRAAGQGGWEVLIQRRWRQLPAMASSLHWRSNERLRVTDHRRQAIMKDGDLLRCRRNGAAGQDCLSGPQGCRGVDFEAEPLTWHQPLRKPVSCDGTWLPRDTAPSHPLHVVFHSPPGHLLSFAPREDPVPISCSLSAV